MKFLRNGKLVYIAIRKNASTFYTNFFKQQLKWNEIPMNSVDWENDIVFSHISDPIKRHIKGLVEAIIHNTLLNDLYNDPKFCHILGYSIVDPHCVPIYPTLGKNTEKIDWILLDSYIPSEDLTSKFLLKYNIRTNLTYEPFRYRHTNEENTKDMREKIKELIDLYKDNDTLNLLYEQDKMLYNNVKYKFNKFFWDSGKDYKPDTLNYTNNKDLWMDLMWDKISWLRNE